MPVCSQQPATARAVISSSKPFVSMIDPCALSLPARLPADACSSSICARSPWEDVEAVEEALTSVVSSKRHKAKPPSYQCGCAV